MERKEFNIPTNDNRQAVNLHVKLIRPFLKGLQPREADIYAEIVYQYALKLVTVPDKKDCLALVLSTEGRKVIVEQLQITQQLLRNVLAKLKKTGILKDGIISDTYLLKLNEEAVQICFNFVIKDET